MDIDYIKSIDFLSDLEIIGMDFETFYGKGYTLKSMPTSEYIRDPRFKIHGLGVYGLRTGIKLWLIGEEIKEFLDSLIWERVALLCHHAHFDGFILHQHFHRHPKVYLDTLSISRGIWGPHLKHGLDDLARRCGVGQKLEGILDSTKDVVDLEPEHLDRLGEYCINDIEVTAHCFDHMVSRLVFPPKELEVIDYTVRAFCDPRLRVDAALAQQELDEELELKRDLLEREGVTREILMSNDKLAEEFRSRGLAEEDIPMKFSEKQQKLVYAFAKNDTEFTDLQNDPAVGGLVEARIAVKTTLVESRARRLINHGAPGALPIYLRYWAAITGRWGGCFSENTPIVVLRNSTIYTVTITKVLPTDLVWDGEEFVAHGGVTFSGFKEVIEYDGIRATPEHKFWRADTGAPCTLAEAKANGYDLAIGQAPDSSRINQSVQRPGNQTQLRDRDLRTLSDSQAPSSRDRATCRLERRGNPSSKERRAWEATYDIINCGPRHRYMVYGRYIAKNSDKLNPQNFPKGRGRQTKRLRNAILPPPGYVMVTVDSSQIEPRYLAWLCENEALLDVFRRGEDPYLWMASSLYQEEFDDKEKYAAQRQLGKCVLIALGYGMGVRKFVHTARTQFGLDLTVERPTFVGLKKTRSQTLAEWAHERYRAENRDTTVAFWWKMENMLRHMCTAKEDEFMEVRSLAFDKERAWLSNNCSIWYPGLKEHGGDFYYKAPHSKRWRKIYGAHFTENLTQGDSRNVVAYQGIPISRRYFVALLAHDEVVLLARKEEATEARAYALMCMSQPPMWAPDLPVAAEAKIIPCYG